MDKKITMKNKYRPISAGLACLCLCTSVFAQEANTPPVQAIDTPVPAAAPLAAYAGFLKSVRGDVRLLDAGGAARPAPAGEQVQPTDRIVTGAGAAASLVLRDGTVIVVGPTSRLDLKTFKFDATTQEGNLLVALLQGSMRMVTGLIGKAHPETVRIETKSAYVGIRGTDFIVQADPLP